MEEEASLAASTNLVIAATTCTLLFSVLEMAVYFLYNRKVSISCGHKTEHCTACLVPPLDQDPAERALWDGFW